jgi:hypothetical protein
MVCRTPYSTLVQQKSVIISIFLPRPTTGDVIILASTWMSVRFLFFSGYRLRHPRPFHG